MWGLDSTGPLCIALKGGVSSIAFLLLPLLTVLLLTWLFSLLFPAHESAKIRDRIVFLAYGCAVFGTSFGLLIGLNKHQFASAGIAALIGGLTGAVTAYFNKNALKTYLPNLPIVIAAIGFSLAFGFLYGSSARSSVDLIEADIALHKYESEKQYIDTKIAFLKKTVETGTFDQKLYETIFGKSTSADFRLVSKKCSI
jgi:sugar phosphate permease